jgi:hypothetical protein
MSQYLKALENAVITEIGAVEQGLHDVYTKPAPRVGGVRGVDPGVGTGSKGIGHNVIRTLAEKLDASDAVFRLVVNVAAKMRYEGVLRMTVYGKQLSVASPKVVRGMDRLDEVDWHTRLNDAKFDIVKWFEGVQDVMVGLEDGKGVPT